MAIAFVNGVTSSSSSGSTTIAAAAQSHTTGNTVIVFSSNYTSGAVRAVSSIADTGGNTYTKAGGDYGGDANHRMEAWFATNITGNASNVVTITFSASATFRVIGVIQYSGMHTTSPYDASATGTLSSTNPLVSNAVTTTSDDQIALGWFISWTNIKQLNTSGSSTKRVESGSGGSADNSAIFERIAATAGAYTVSADPGSGTETYAIIVRSFKVAAGATSILRQMMLQH